MDRRMFVGGVAAAGIAGIRERCGKKRVARPMRQSDLRAMCARPFRVTT